MHAILRTKALYLLVSIGVLDLVVTAVLHARGLIVEMNPLMRPFIDRSEWQFALVKGMTLGVGWCVMRRYADSNPRFVRNICLAGSFMYIGIWLVGFMSGR